MCFDQKCGDKYKGLVLKPLFSLIRVFKTKTGRLRNCSQYKKKMDSGLYFLSLFTSISGLCKKNFNFINLLACWNWIFFLTSIALKTYTFKKIFIYFHRFFIFHIFHKIVKNSEIYKKNSFDKPYPCWHHPIR